MPVIRLIGDDWGIDDKVILATDLSKKIATAFRSFKDKLGVNMASWEILDVVGEGKKVKMGSRVYDTKKSFNDQGIKTGDAIYFRKKSGASPKREKKEHKFAPEKSMEEIMKPKTPPKPIKGLSTPSSLQKAAEAAAAPAPQPPAPPAPAPVPEAVPAQPTPAEAAPVAAPAAPKPPTPQPPKPPTPIAQKAPPPAPVAKPRTPLPAPPAPKVPTPQAAPAPAAVPVVPAAPTPPTAAPTPTPPVVEAVKMLPAAPKPATPLTKAAPAPPTQTLQEAVATVVLPPPVQAAVPAAVPAARQAQHEAVLAQSDVSAGSVELVALREELLTLKRRRQEDDDQWRQEKLLRDQSMRDTEGRLSQMRTDELNLSRTAKEESTRRERQAREELEQEKRRFDSERTRLESELQRFKKDDEARKEEVEKNRRQGEIDKAEFRRKHLQAEIAKIEAETSLVSSSPSYQEGSAVLAQKPAGETTFRPRDDFLAKQDEGGPRPGESEADYRHRIQRIALQVLELEVQEEVLARDLHAAEKRRDTMARIQRTQASLPAEPWWHEKQPRQAERSSRRAPSPTHYKDEAAARDSPAPSTPGRQSKGARWTSVDQRRRDAASRRARGYERSPSPTRPAAPAAKEVAKEVLTLMKDQIAQESGGVKAQERVSEALREMRSVKEELGRWRQCMSSERTDLAFSMLRHTTETPGPSPEQQESSSPAPPVADLAANVPSDLREYGIELMELMMEKAQHRRQHPAPPTLPALPTYTSPLKASMEEEECASPLDVNDYRSRTKALRRIRQEELGVTGRAGPSQQQYTQHHQQQQQHSQEQFPPQYTQQHYQDPQPRHATPPRAVSHEHYQQQPQYQQQQQYQHQSHQQQPQQQQQHQSSPERGLPAGCQIVGESQVVMPLEVAKALLSSQQLQHVPQLSSSRQGVLASPSASPSPGHRHGYDTRELGFGGMKESNAPVSPEPVPAHQWVTSPPPAQPVLGGFLTDAYSVPPSPDPHSASMHSAPVYQNSVYDRKRSPDLLSTHSLSSPQQASPRAASPYSAPSQSMPAVLPGAQEAIRRAKQVIQSYQHDPHPDQAQYLQGQPHPSQHRGPYGY